jgi:hypothetical protein
MLACAFDGTHQGGQCVFSKCILNVYLECAFETYIWLICLWNITKIKNLLVKHFKSRECFLYKK